MFSQTHRKAFAELVSWLSGAKAMTLVEVLLALLISSLIIGIPVLSLQNAFALWEKGRTMAELDESSRLALQWLTQDLHEAKEFTYADAERIDLVRFDNQQIRYYLRDGTTFMRARLNPSQEGRLLKDLTYFRFTFRDLAGNIIPNPVADSNRLSSVRLVSIWTKAARNRARSELWSSVKIEFLPS